MGKSDFQKQQEAKEAAKPAELAQERVDRRARLGQKAVDEPDLNKE